MLSSANTANAQSDSTASQLTPSPETNPAIAQTEAELQSLSERLMESRKLSTSLAAPLSDEDQTVQAMDDASPTKWHLAHTTWFYEAFVLREHLAGYESFDARLDYCFNSYYELKGERHPRARRGLLTRPSATEVRNYRRHVDAALRELVATLDEESQRSDTVAHLLELGINHEQQHQELLLTDILALFARNPLFPAYQQPAATTPDAGKTKKPTWTAFPGGITQIGREGEGFHYDNEAPRHDALVPPFKLANRLVTNGEWQAFIDDDAYQTATLWLSDGWAEIQAQGWTAPGYWQRFDRNTWQQMTLAGLIDIDPAAPVSHISFYEAEAFARWANARLPTEFEWEVASRDGSCTGNTMGSGILRPQPATGEANTQLSQLYGDVWEWTASAYLPYPGYRPPEGAVGEYNGKFMSNQYVLRGASCLTADGHSRATYRNFFYPDKRWQMTGLRLAKDVS